MRDLLSILLLFCNKFTKFNNTGTCILDYLSYDINPYKHSILFMGHMQRPRSKSAASNRGLLIKS